jgi:hypothetical protein
MLKYRIYPLTVQGDMELETERQLASRVKSKNYIPPEARDPEKIKELRKARKQAKKEHTAKRKASLEICRIAILNGFENDVSKRFNKITNPEYSKSVNTVGNMLYLMNFILANPRMLNLLNEFEEDFIHLIVSTRNRINMVLKLNKEQKRSYRQRKEKKRPRWARRQWNKGTGMFERVCWSWDSHTETSSDSD